MNKELKKTLQELDRQKNIYEHQMKIAHEQTMALDLLMAGIKPNSLTTYYTRFAALNWLRSRTAGSPVWFFAASDDVREVKNYVAMAPTRFPLQAAPLTVDTFVGLIEWLRSNAFIFLAGSASHRFFAERFNELEEARQSIIDALQSAFDGARTSSFEKLHELRVLLGLPATTEVKTKKDIE